MICASLYNFDRAYRLGYLVIGVVGDEFLVIVELGLVSIDVLRH